MTPWPGYFIATGSVDEAFFNDPKTVYSLLSFAAVSGEVYTKLPATIRCL